MQKTRTFRNLQRTIQFSWKKRAYGIPSLTYKPFTPFDCVPTFSLSMKSYFKKSAQNFSLFPKVQAGLIKKINLTFHCKFYFHFLSTTKRCFSSLTCKFSIAIQIRRGKNQTDLSSHQYFNVNWSFAQNLTFFLLMKCCKSSFLCSTRRLKFILMLGSIKWRFLWKLSIYVYFIGLLNDFMFVYVCVCKAKCY